MQFGRGYWKLNIEIMKEETFRAHLAQIYKGWKNLRPLFTSWKSWWEGVKERVGIMARRYVKWRRNKEMGEFRSVRRRLQILYEEWNKGGELDGEELNNFKHWQRSSSILPGLPRAR